MLWSLRKKIGFALCLFELLYVVSSYYFLNSPRLKRAINANPEELKIEWDWAVSPLPGWAYVRRPSVRVQDSNIQMYLELPSVKILVFVPSLWKRSFEALSVSGSGLNFRFRLRREAKEISSTLLQRLPSIPGLTNLQRPERQELTPQHRADQQQLTHQQPPSQASSSPSPTEALTASTPWTLQLKNIHIEKVKEVWFEDYRFVGDGEVEGGFRLVPGKGAEVYPSCVTAKSGEIFFGDNRVVQNLNTSIRATIRAFQSENVPELKIFDYVTAHVSGKARIDNMRFLNYYLNRLPWLHLDGGFGDLTVALKLRDGIFENGSQLRLSSKNIEAHLFRQTAVGQGETSWEIEDNESGRRGNLVVQLKTYQVSHAHFPSAGIRGENLKISVHTPDLKVSEKFSRLGVSVDIPEAKLNDFRYFNDYLPKSSGLKFVGGKGTIAGRFEADAHPDWNDSGNLQIVGNEAQIKFGKFTVQGNAKMTAILKKGSIQSGHFDLSGSKVELVNVLASQESGKDSHLSEWWGDATLKRAHLKTAKPASLEGIIRLQGKDARPLIALFTPEGLPNLVKNFLAFDGLEASAMIRLSDKAFVIPGLSAKGGGKKLHGWLTKQQGKEEGKLLLEYGPLAAGLELHEGNLRLKLNDAFGWFGGKNQKSSPSE